MPRFVDLHTFHRVCYAVADVAFDALLEDDPAFKGPVCVTPVGSTAVLPWLKAADERPVWNSKDVDFLADSPQIADATAYLGRGSPFHLDAYVYAESLPPFDWMAPSDWPARAREYRNPGMDVQERHHRLRVPAPVDLVVAKLFRGDEKDWEFAEFCVASLGAQWLEIRDSLRRVQAEHPGNARVEAHIERAVLALETREP